MRPDKAGLPARLKSLFPLLLVLTAGCGGTAENRSGDSEAKVELSDVPPNIEGSALQAEGRDPLVRKFYEAGQWTAIWSPRAEHALKSALSQRTRHGLERVQFLPKLAELSPAAREIALTTAALRFADALARGVADPAKLHVNYTHPRPEVDLATGLISAIEVGRVRAWLGGLTPGTAEYSALASAYLEQKTPGSRSSGPDIAGGDAIKPGDRDPRIPQIVAALAENRYLTAPAAGGSPPASAETGDLYTAAIVTAVKAVQQDYGIHDDGVIGSDTLAVLNIRSIDRLRSLAVAMERLRWLTRSPPPTRIDVNTAAAELSFFREGKLIDQRKVVVGKPGKETPQLSTSMFRLAANPTWTVPRSIQNGEMAGKGSAYFRRNDLSWQDGWIVQGSGPRNSLGLVKFDLANDLAIYLHDTPAKALFDRHQRQLSHGCVRVSDAVGFAQMLATQEGISAEWSQARAAGTMTFVKLPRTIPVRLLYRTAYVGADKTVTYRTDPYGWNVAVAESLGFAREAGKPFRSETGDVGP